MDSADWLDEPQLDRDGDRLLTALNRFFCGRKSRPWEALREATQAIDDVFTDRGCAIVSRGIVVVADWLGEREVGSWKTSVMHVINP